jgi:DNA polymerase-3 subunit gamma/tau
MASQVFYRKWRPQKLAEVVGQEPVTRTLLNALSGGRISHAYLFCGPRGTGKTSTARILAKAVNCLTNGKGEPCNTCEMCQAITGSRSLDIIEIDAASNTGVDDIRSLREKVNYAPNQARYKVYIIDEVHMLSTSASNALLKTLEEPPAHVIFILATTESHKILPTILSRCQRFDFRRHSQANIVIELERVCQGEGINVETEALRLIAKNATGSMRDALNLLEQLTTYYGNEISLQQVQSTLGITGDWRTRELVKHIINNDVTSGMSTISSINNDGLDLRQFNREMVEYLRSLLLIKTGSTETLDLTSEDMDELKNLAVSTSLEQILKATKIFGQLDIGFDNYSTLPLELALVDCILPSGFNKEETPAQAVSEPVQPVSIDTPPHIETYNEPAKQEPAPVINKEPAPVGNDVLEQQPKEDFNGFALEGGTEIERLRLYWKQVIQNAPSDTKRTPAIAILRSAGVKPISIENDIVSLSFKHTYHKEQVEKLENQRIAEKIISNFIGRPCRIRCLLEDNHLVNAALKLGAQIIDVEE